MQWILIGLGLVSGYWVSEWPGRVFPATNSPLRASQLSDPTARRCALFHPLVFVTATVVAIVGFVLSRSLAPDLSERYFAFWVFFLILAAFGAAVGLFEIATGLSPRFSYFEANSSRQEFYVDRSRAAKVGTWRIASASVMCTLFVVSSWVFSS